MSMTLSSRPARILAVAAIALATLHPPAVGAQAGPPNQDDALEVRKLYLADMDTLESKFLGLAKAFPEEKYTWRPAAGIRSVGEVFMHVASEFYVYAPLAYGAQRSTLIPRGEENFKKFESNSTREDVLKHLQEGFAYAKQQINAVEPSQLTGSRKLFGGDHNIIETSFAMLDDLHEHLGQLIAYARVNGVTPPWSK